MAAGCASGAQKRDHCVAMHCTFGLAPLNDERSSEHQKVNILGLSGTLAPKLGPVYAVCMWYPMACVLHLVAVGHLGLKCVWSLLAHSGPVFGFRSMRRTVSLMRH